MKMKNKYLDEFVKIDYDKLSNFNKLEFFYYILSLVNKNKLIYIKNTNGWHTNYFKSLFKFCILFKILFSRNVIHVESKFKIFFKS